MTDKLLDHFRQQLGDRLSELNTTARAVSERAQLNPGAVSDILSGRSRNPGLVNLEAIAQALGSDLLTLLGSDGKDISPRSPAPLQQSGDTANSLGSSVGRTVLLVIGGGIAAYKSLDLIRRLREKGLRVRVVMTEAAQQFVTPLAAGALSGETVFTELFDRDAEHDIGHIRLSRQSDLVIIAPATADLLARMALGLADDLATAALLASDKPILVAPAMNPAMWSHPATARNIRRLRDDGVHFIGPNRGEMAESGEAGLGRMAEPLEIAAAGENLLRPNAAPLAGRHVLITSGPTHEPIDPVRYLANRSSGKQGHAIAAAAHAAGARVTLVSGPVALADPRGVETQHVETAREMLEAVERSLPADVAIMAAAVADWRIAAAAESKIKKGPSGAAPELRLTENPDILKTISQHPAHRPRLVIGFAAETDDLLDNAGAKLARKGCDWIVANDVSPAGGVMGGDRNSVHILSERGVESWPTMDKTEVAERLIAEVVDFLTADPLRQET